MALSFPKKKVTVGFMGFPGETKKNGRLLLSAARGGQPCMEQLLVD